jgi:hypothetical protein
MEVAADSEASDGSYIWVPDGVGDVRDSGNYSGYAEYTFQVPVSGDYVIWGRVNAVDVAHDSFFVSIDGGDYIRWVTQISKNWVWDQINNYEVSDPVIYYLETGDHSLIVKNREDGTKIDKILITDDMVYIPD